MDDQSHIRLVDAHTESVRRYDRSQLTFDESLLHILFCSPAASQRENDLQQFLCAEDTQRLPRSVVRVAQ